MKYSETELRNILNFTNALADRLQDENKIDFASMQSDETSLAEAEREAVAFAERRKAGLFTSRSEYGETDADELNEIRENIRDYYRRTRKIIRG
jgi:hypothetical protein